LAGTKALDAELSNLNLGGRFKPGDTVAISCGSHAIANYAVIIKAVVDHFEKLKTASFLVPAMGSHGGGTAEDQRELLHTLGISEEVTGAETRSSMETRIVGHCPSGCPSIATRAAFQVAQRCAERTFQDDGGGAREAQWSATLSQGCGRLSL
jgi:hypothetical protein